MRVKIISEIQRIIDLGFQPDEQADPLDFRFRIELHKTVESPPRFFTRLLRSERFRLKLWNCNENEVSESDEIVSVQDECLFHEHETLSDTEDLAIAKAIEFIERQFNAGESGHV